MITTQPTPMITIQSPQTDRLYKFDLERQTRTDYAEYMNPDSKYEREYFQVNVYDERGHRLNFGFLDELTDTDSVQNCVLSVIDFIENPEPDISSRFD